MRVSLILKVISLGKDIYLEYFTKSRRRVLRFPFEFILCKAVRNSPFLLHISPSAPETSSQKFCHTPVLADHVSANQ